MNPADLRASIAEIAIRAGRLALDAKGATESFLKPDGSIVTTADRDVESFIRSELHKLTPSIPVWGEEHGFAQDDGDGVWVVDPIDGTTNYAAGAPLWGVSIALVQESTIQVGALAIPEFDELYLAARGEGATRNDRTLNVLSPGPIEPSGVVGYCEAVAKLGLSLPGKQRCLGSFVVEGTWVASGRFRGMVGMRERLYDVAAAVLLIEELGGDVRYADGHPFEVRPLLDGRRIDRPWILFPPDSGFTV